MPRQEKCVVSESGLQNKPRTSALNIGLETETKQQVATKRLKAGIRAFALKLFNSYDSLAGLGEFLLKIFAV